MTTPTAELTVIRAGLVSYEQAWERQKQIHEARVQGAVPDTVLLLQHPSVYTAGKRTLDEHRPTDGTPVVDVDRGGLITWHGPGQLVGYPIVRLGAPLDVVAYVRRIEDLLMAVCGQLGLPTSRIAGRSGVWVTGGTKGSDRKVAAIGVRVRWGVAMHGFALNCDPDLSNFDAIVPCGLMDASVTSLSKELGRPIPVSEVIDLVESRLPMLANR